MWFNRNAKQRKRISIIIDDQVITAALVDNDMVVDRAQYAIEHFEVYQSLIFNPTSLHTFFNDFLQKHGCKNIQGIVLLRGSVLHEFIYTKGLDKDDDFYGTSAVLQLDTTHWYFARVSFPTQFQLTLLFMETTIEIIAIVPYFFVMYNLLADHKIQINSCDCATVQNCIYRAFSQKHTPSEMVDDMFLIEALNVLLDS